MLLIVLYCLNTVPPYFWLNGNFFLWVWCSDCRTSMYHVETSPRGPSRLVFVLPHQARHPVRLSLRPSIGSSWLSTRCWQVCVILALIITTSVYRDIRVNRKKNRFQQLCGDLPVGWAPSALCSSVNWPSITNLFYNRHYDEFFNPSSMKSDRKSLCLKRLQYFRFL